MSPAEPATERVYARPPHFAVHYRAGRRLRWSSEARADYSALLLLEGTLRWRASESDGEAARGGARTGASAPAPAAGASPSAQASDDEVAGEIAAGSALLAAPGDALQASSAGRAEFVAVTFSSVYVLDSAARARLTRADSLVTFRARAALDDSRLARLARDLADELLEEVDGQELVVGAIVEHALVHLLRRYANVRRPEHMELSRAGLVDRRIRLAVELMHAHMHRELSLEEIAAAAHLSPFHFSRLFKKLTGSTPHAYLAALRAARARDLLSETDLSVTEIGARVGYMSSSHFSKAFRQSTGISPRAYRKALVRG
jgi:AraC family transcriptional regulator